MQAQAHGGRQQSAFAWSRVECDTQSKRDFGARSGLRAPNHGESYPRVGIHRRQREARDKRLLGSIQMRAAFCPRAMLSQREPG